MTAPELDESRDPLDLLGEQFLQRLRAGEAITPESFAAEHPTHRQQLLDLLPTLLLLEQAKRDRESTASSGRRLSMPQLQRLGEYRIVREVGRGGMGVVFEAVQESLGRRVALKVLPQASLLSVHQLERFRREAQTAARLHHTNIVPVFDSGAAEGFHYYAMQFIDGQGLDAVVTAQRQKDRAGSGALREQCRLAASIGVAVADALEHAHALGTLHRDIKPANLLLDQQQHVWVTDFGLAKALEQQGLTHSGDVLGTLQYMAPEQFDGRYDVRSEVYALGATLWELVALQPAFTAASRGELMARIRDGRCERLSQRAPAVPRDLETIVSRAMQKDPAARYASARELGDDLRAFLEDRPIAARRQSSAELLLLWCRRNRALASAFALTAAVVLVAAVVGWTAYWTTDDALQRAKASAEAERVATTRAGANLDLAMAAFGEVFDALVGPDPLHALTTEDAEDDGQVEAAQRPPIDAGDLEVLQRMLTFYDRFAAQNAGSNGLDESTARAHARVGAIQARLGDFDAAAVAYGKALRLLGDVKGRDVTRDLAAMQQELGQVQVRRGEPLEAAACFEQSLKLLTADVADSSRSARLLQARAHWLVATVVEFRAPRPGPGGRGGARGRRGGGMPELPPGERAPLDRGRGEAGRRPELSRPEGARGGPGRDPRLQRLWRAAPGHLDSAQHLLAALLAEQPDDVETRLLQARCWLAQSRLPGQGPEAAHGLVAQAIERLGQLVGAAPQADELRFEWCAALAIDHGKSLAESMAYAQQGVEAARQLVAHQPGHPEYRALLGRSLSRLGSFLHERDRDAQASAGREVLLEAEALQQALVDAAPEQRRFAMDLQDTRRRLMRVQLAAGDAAAAQATGRRLLQLWAEQRRDWLRAIFAEGGPEAGAGDRRHAEARELRSLLERAGLRIELEALRAQVQERPERR